MNPVFLYSRPHPIHAKFAESVDSNFLDFNTKKTGLGFVDVWLRQYDLPNSDVYLGEDGAYLPAAMAGKENVFTILAIRFYDRSKLNPYGFFHWKNLDKLSGVIATSEMIKKDFLETTGLDIPVEVVNPFISSERGDILGKVEPNLSSNKIVTILEDAERKERQKGLDILIRAFGTLDEKLELHLVGENTEKFESRKNNIYGHGYLNTNGISSILKEASLYVQASRWDSFSVSTLEAMTAGVPVIVTEKTGIKSVLNDEFVSQVNANDLAKKIKKYFELNTTERKSLSEEVRNKSQGFDEETKLDEFRKKFELLSGRA